MLSSLASGANVNEASNDDNNTCPLHVLAASGHLAALDLLLLNDAALDVTDSKGWTPLHYAASCNQPGVARLLIKRGSKSDQKDATGECPYDVACHYKSEAVRIILEGSRG